MSVEVFQFKLSEEEVDLINKYGWDATPRTSAYADLRMGDIDLKKWWGEYTHVATVDCDTAEQSFEIMNLWNESDRVVRHATTSSMSVGDIVLAEGNYLLCDIVGWKWVIPEEVA
jgi:hypothetical protein